MYSVLIVDDVEVMRLKIMRLKIWGEVSGFQIVSQAVNGQDALMKLKGSPVDLVITDIKMPLLGGIELTQIITQQKLAQCVVLLSDYTDFSHARQGFTSGAFDFIGKPINEEALYELLKRVTEYLVNIKIQKEAVTRLETVVTDHIHNIHSIKEFEGIVEHMKCGNSIVLLETVDSMIKTVVTTFKDDFIQSRRIISKATREIVETVIAQYSFITLFYDMAMLKDFMMCEDVKTLSEQVITVIKSLICFMEKFIINEQPLIKQVCYYALENVDQDISVGGIAQAMFISKNYLSVTFKEKTGLMLMEYLTMVKIERAKKLILDNQLKNYQVAGQLGFKDNEYFSKLFKKYAGISPTDYRLKNSKW